MKDIKDQGELTRISLGIYKRAVFIIDTFKLNVKKHSGFSTSRNGVAEAFAELLEEAENDIDYSRIYNAQSLKEEIGNAIATVYARKRRQTPEEQ